MPPRGFVIAIVVFWLGASTAMVVRDVLPRWRADAAPRYVVELTDQVASPQVVWHVLEKGEKIGWGVTQIRRRPDRTFEMVQNFNDLNLKSSVLGVPLAIKRLNTTYNVTREGRLLGIHVAGDAKVESFLTTAALDGEVKAGVLALRLSLAGQRVNLGSLGEIPVDENGSVLNPMHLLHRLPNLREGQRWKVPLFDPFRMFVAKFLTPSSAFLEAEVTAGTLDWNRPNVECFRISYREPGKKEVAQTWVRRADGLVIAQHVKQHGHEYVIRRVPEGH